ncbi:polysaccharide biosynthesis protein [Prochlorococcus marinus str. MU1402]|uniref:nucleoside-diphosphate sugar epimerase/dehydratase n=1 Tax=Prochlorococcus marinus TaxID=1219 RepID=UPI001ADC53BA|nr:nucleoside-diphosphate sugar epimerase/dehydratase [Prochlorococcus marinus]MBO8232399.1 polysaccharide biosynthesis protein [Prochlorococcus marinus XMU1402]MBW3057127.1 polysaccharide biosynthesis protein [Prochlorococcus marinus str. MU1402]
MNFNISLQRKLLSLPQFYRRILILFLDILLIIAAIYPNYSRFLIQGEQLNSYQWLLISPAICIPILFILGNYRSLTRYLGSKSVYLLSFRLLISFFFTYIFGIIFGKAIPDLSIWIWIWLTSTSLMSLSRFLIRDWLQSIFFIKRRRSNTVIYGAGNAGVILSKSLKIARLDRIIAFVDDDPQLWGNEIDGIKIISPKNLNQFIKSKKIEKVLLAMPLIKLKDKKRIVNSLNEVTVSILEVPTLAEIASGQLIVENLKPVNINDLLRRDVAKKEVKLIQKGINSKIIMITGGGGSIGSELCLQLLNYLPKKLIIIERNESSLYDLIHKLKKYSSNCLTEVVYILGDISHDVFVDNLMNKYNVQVIFHAAAYKHVPIVEENQLSGIENNLINTYKLCQLSLKNNIENFLLISSDKAVRPTNTMGATKRAAELIVQASDKLKKECSFSIVRFGNVIGSSGSVVPLFQKQISQGGPITITDKKVIRYFMTIEEAVGLVLQVQSLAKGGDVFLLDMGKPVKIIDLAYQMAKLNGKIIKDSTNPHGDIDIIEIGLRPGEKLYEELLISGKSIRTQHPLIYKAIESLLPYEEIEEAIQKIKLHISKNNKNDAIKCLKEMVPEWEIKTIN